MTGSVVVRRIALVAAAVALAAGLTACDTVSGLFSGKDSKAQLPGTRISVLAMERQLRPSLEATDNRIILPQPLDTPAWPGAGGFSHHAMHHLVMADAPKKIWETGIGEGTGLRNHIFAEPIVADGKIFTMDSDGEISAIDAATGKRLWREKTAPKSKQQNFGFLPWKSPPSRFLGGALSVDGGKLFATTGAAEVVAFDASNGKELWRTPVETPIRAAPTVNGGRVFIITIENQVVALAANDGRKLWSYSGASTPTVILGGTAPAVDGGVVVAALTTGELVALRTDSGTQLWLENVVATRRTEAAASLPDIAARPVIDKGRVYAVGQSGVMVAIDLRTGSRLWEVPIAGINEPWVAGDFLYAVSVDSEAICVDARTGRIVWVTQLPGFANEKRKKGRIVWAGPALASDRLILVGSNGEALSLSPYSGVVLGKVELDSSASLVPVFANSTMYVLDDDGQLAAYR
jgi:outer membrane protein assembly factor BamB